MIVSQSYAHGNAQLRTMNHIWTLPVCKAVSFVLPEQVKIAAIYPAFG